jgi:2'-5' RNA ligase
MKRLFIALEMPEPLRERLAGMMGGITGARWVDPTNFHLTLRFIGEVDGDIAQDIADGLSSLRVASFDLALEGVDRFESRGRVRAVWVGVKLNPALAALQRKIEILVAAAGIVPERRKFKPHVTLARFSNIPVTEVGPYLAVHGSFRTEPVPVQSVILFESILGRAGPTYHPELEVPLILVPAVMGAKPDRDPA